MAVGLIPSLGKEQFDETGSVIQRLSPLAPDQRIAAESSDRAGRLVGEEARRVEIFSEGTEIRIKKLRQIQEQYLSGHEIF
jgi:hypothetical protein